MLRNTDNHDQIEKSEKPVSKSVGVISGGFGSAACTFFRNGAKVSSTQCFCKLAENSKLA
jgi:hypothetical protein